MATAIALGNPFLGTETRRARALYLTAEDDAAELWRRQAAINAALSADMGDLDGSLFLATLVGEIGTALVEFDPMGRASRSARMQALLSTIEANGIGFVVVDNCTHAMAGDHNDLHAVGQFMAAMHSVAQACDGAVLLLHHPNKGGDDYLGSVAWETQVRSRILMNPSDREGDDDARFLTNPKANYAKAGSRIDFRWLRGAFVTDAEIDEDERADLAATAQAANDNAIFLACLALRNTQLRPVSENPAARTFAPKIFADMSEARGIGRTRLEAAMERLFRLGKISRQFLYRDTGEGKDRHGLKEVSADLFSVSADTRRPAADLPADLPPTPPLTSPLTSADVPLTSAHTPPLSYREGGNGPLEGHYPSEEN